MCHDVDWDALHILKYWQATTCHNLQVPEAIEPALSFGKAKAGFLVHIVVFVLLIKRVWHVGYVVGFQYLFCSRMVNNTIIWDAKRNWVDRHFAIYTCEKTSITLLLVETYTMYARNWQENACIARDDGFALKIRTEEVSISSGAALWPGPPGEKMKRHKSQGANHPRNQPEP